MRDAFVGLGSNLGVPEANLLRALRMIDELPNTEVVDVSHMFRSEPWGVEDQPAFVNAVARLRTRLLADQLLGYLLDIETEMGRVRGEDSGGTGPERNGPRVIDLDLLLLGEDEWRTEELVLPHPRMHERDFVLTPLLQIAPDVRWPDERSIRRGGDLVGKVVADLGRIPGAGELWYDWEVRYAEPLGSGGCAGGAGARYVGPAEDAPAGAPAGAPAEPGRPLAAPGAAPDDEWVQVDSGWGFGMDVEIKLAKLQQAGIPAELSHRPFADKLGLPMGGFEPSRILVPASRLDDARRVLRSGGPLPYGAGERPTRERPAWWRIALILALIAWAGPYAIRLFADFFESVAAIFQ